MHVMRISVLLLVVTTCPLMAEETKVKTGFTAQYEVKTVKDIDYYKGEGYDKVKHKLDLYLPKGKKNFPVLFFVHGGGWTTGDKNYFGVYSSIGTFFAQRGIGAVITNYRLTPKVKHPGHIEDVARAFAWTWKNIARHGGDKDNIFISGHSAGGHLVALLATNETYLKKEGIKLSAIKAVVPISGVYVLAGNFLSSVFGEDKKVRETAFPLLHVKKGLPPFFILYAENDFPGCGKLTSELFKKALLDKGVKAMSQEIAKSNHISILLSVAKKGDVVSKAILNFIARKLD